MKTILAVFTTIGIFAGMTAGASAGQSGRQRVDVCCTQQTVTTKKVVVGHKDVIVRKPVYKRVGYKNVKVRKPIYANVPVAKPAPCRDCAADLTAIYLGCVTRNGQQFWVYRAENGVTYSMTVQRRGERDRIRVFPNGRILWVAASG